jgi:hypothetical protein
VGGRLRLGVYDITGRLVDGFTEADFRKGAVTWAGTSSSGTVLSPGVYFIRLESPSGTVSKKVVKR